MGGVNPCREAIPLEDEIAMRAQRREDSLSQLRIEVSRNAKYSRDQGYRRYEMVQKDKRQINIECEQIQPKISQKLVDRQYFSIASSLIIQQINQGKPEELERACDLNWVRSRNNHRDSQHMSKEGMLQPDNPRIGSGLKINRKDRMKIIPRTFMSSQSNTNKSLFKNNSRNYLITQKTFMSALSVTLATLMTIYFGLTPEQRHERQVYAVSAGAHVSYSSFWKNSEHSNTHYQLDINQGPEQCWSPKPYIKGQWIQVSQEYPKLWTGVIVQGRADMNQWVKSIKMAFTINGKEWKNVQGGQVFEANSDRNTKIRITFKEPVFARALRIYPQQYQGVIAMRFDAIYLDLQ